MLRPAPAADAPIRRDELLAGALRPDLLVTHVLGSPGRIAANLSAATPPWGLFALLLFTSLAASVPFGAVAPVGEVWSACGLYAGTLLLCIPSLYVVQQFIGIGISFERTAGAAFVISAAAALFCLAFAPVLWFLCATSDGPGDGTGATVMRGMLVVAGLMGVLQLGRCLSRLRSADTGGVQGTFLLWMPLLLWIGWRMADVMGLRG